MGDVEALKWNRHGSIGEERIDAISGAGDQQKRDHNSADERAFMLLRRNDDCGTPGGVRRFGLLLHSRAAFSSNRSHARGGTDVSASGRRGRRGRLNFAVARTDIIGSWLDE